MRFVHKLFLYDRYNNHRESSCTDYKLLKGSCLCHKKKQKNKTKQKQTNKKSEKFEMQRVQIIRDFIRHQKVRDYISCN